MKSVFNFILGGCAVIIALAILCSVPESYAQPITVTFDAGKPEIKVPVYFENELHIVELGDRKFAILIVTNTGGNSGKQLACSMLELQPQPPKPEQ